MTHRIDVARSRDVVARWCDLAEQRLEYLTELFETGRWRRFHSELDFLENIREAKAAVETWRVLETREASLDNSGIDISWLGRAGVALSRRDTLHDQADRPSPQPVEIAVYSPPSELSMSVETECVSSDEALAVADSGAAAMDTAALMLDIDSIEQRYPLLRNAL